MIWSSVELDQCNKVGDQGNSANSLTSHVNIFVISGYDNASTIPFEYVQLPYQKNLQGGRTESSDFFARCHGIEILLYFLSRSDQNVFH
jgi:hypothetical protein